jgi:hypothetical protein
MRDSRGRASRYDPWPPGRSCEIIRWRTFSHDGTPFRTFTEWVEKSKADQQRADFAADRVREQAKLVLTERQRVDEERQRANAAEERGASLAARLRELGVEPE